MADPIGSTVTVAGRPLTCVVCGTDRFTYRELDDLSHCYPREMNAPILDWLSGK